jgi:hypothetical protein
VGSTYVGYLVLGSRAVLGPPFVVFLEPPFERRAYALFEAHVGGRRLVASMHGMGLWGRQIHMGVMHHLLVLRAPPWEPAIV